MTLLLEAPAPTTADTQDEVEHIFCCDPGRALCGAELDSDAPPCPADCGAAPCVVCAGLEYAPSACRVPGCPWRCQP